MIAPSTLPEWSDRWALFLDVDGTLLEIMSHPDEVRVPPPLKRLLGGAADALGGALALVSGRAIASLDALFAPLCLPAAGLHGLERRDALGRVHYPPGYAERIAVARSGLIEFVQSHAGLLLEDKGAALALHYRNAPTLEPECRRRIKVARQAAGDDFEVQRGKCVFELKPSGHDKGTAISTFMDESPFRGRQPVFVGDDVTDEDGFRAVNQLGGLSIRVGPIDGSCAQLSVGSVTAVLDWLEHCLEHA